MVHPILINLDSDDLQLEISLAAGKPTLIYIYVGDRLEPKGGELFYTMALPADEVLKSVGKPCVTIKNLPELEVDLAEMVSQCSGESWDEVIERMSSFSWYADA